MTWDKLAQRIAEMTPAERQREAKFVEGYDDFKIWTVGLEQAEEAIEDEDGDRIEEGEWYLA
jgi:hypothetical protein